MIACVKKAQRTGDCFINTDPGCGAATAANNGNVQRQLLQIASPVVNLTQAFNYDELNRLASASESGGATPWTQTYGYDRYGNRAVTGASDYKPAPALTPTSTAAFSTATNRINLAGYNYDSAGNMTNETSTRTMTFDAENRMVTFNGGSGTTTYTYDGDGRRVRKVDNAGVTSVYAYNAQGQLAAEYSSLPASTVPGGTSYVLADHLGSTRLMTHPDGTLRSRHDYLPFGEEIGTSIGGRASVPGYGIVDIRQKFTAKERDAESGLDYFGARYFSGAQGRFTSPDVLAAV
jgi:RHS repeat-associated protein